MNILCKFRYNLSISWKIIILVNYLSMLKQRETIWKFTSQTNQD